MRRKALSHTFGNESKAIFTLLLSKVFSYQRRNNNGIEKFLELLAHRRAFTRRASTDLEGFLHQCVSVCSLDALNLRTWAGTTPDTLLGARASRKVGSFQPNTRPRRGQIARCVMLKFFISR